MSTPHKRQPRAAAASPGSDTQVLSLIVVAWLAAVPLLWGLGDRYLWQDEAQTALLAERWLHHGRPLGFDGRNLITMDRAETLAPELAHSLHSDSAAAIRYFVARGDFRSDTTWIGHPWGQFAAAGLSLGMLGKGTWQARLPFALMGIATAVLLYALARRRFRNPWVAPLALALLLGNSCWILHARQCRYYAASSLLLLVTLAAWLRWQDGRRFGAAGFVTAAWCWFQFDYGSIWPVVAILLAEAIRRAWPDPREPLLAGLGFAVCVAPFVWFYQLLERYQTPVVSWQERLLGTASLFDHYVLAIPLLLAVAAWVIARGRTRPSESRLLGLASIVLASFLVWVPATTPFPFHRYLVALTPLGCLLAAWLIAEVAALAPTRSSRIGLAATLLALLVITPLASLPFAWSVPERFQRSEPEAGWLRSGLSLIAAEVTGRLPDPNRDVIAYLEQKLEPGDEVLINYEDNPVMFYTEARVRGGIPGFRIAAADGEPPRFAILRASATIAPVEPFVAAMRPYRWREVPLRAPDFPWSNIPDPTFRRMLREPPTGSVVFLERDTGP